MLNKQIDGTPYENFMCGVTWREIERENIVLPIRKFKNRVILM